MHLTTTSHTNCTSGDNKRPKNGRPLSSEAQFDALAVAGRTVCLATCRRRHSLSRGLSQDAQPVGWVSLFVFLVKEARTPRMEGVFGDTCCHPARGGRCPSTLLTSFTPLSPDTLVARFGYVPRGDRWSEDEGGSVTFAPTRLTSRRQPALQTDVAATARGTD